MTNIISRAIGISTKPKDEWAAVDGESATTQGLLTGYVLPMAAIPAVAGIIGSLLLSSIFGGLASMAGGMGGFGATAGVGLIGAVVGGVLGLAASLVITLVMGLLINALASSFGATQDSAQAMKVAAYAPSAIWLASIALIIPVLGGLLVFAASIWTIFIIHWGLGSLMKTPQDKGVGYSAVVIIIWCVVSIIIGLIVSAVVGVFAVGAALSGAAAYGM